MAAGAVHRHDRGGTPRLGILARFVGRPLETTYLIRSELFTALLMYGGSALPSAPLDLTGPRRLNGARPPARLPSPTARQQQSEPRSEMWSALLGAIGLSLEAASRVKDQAVRTQAAAAWQAMQQLSQRNERLRVYLDEIVDAKAEAVDQTYSELQSAFDGKAEHLSILEEVVGDLHRQLRSLLLLPEVGVVREMVERLEAVVEHDDGAAPAEERLLEQLRGLEIAIRQIDKSSAGGWMRVAQMINGQGNEDPPTIREMDPANKTPI
jgi:hypothetical protein